MNKPPASAPRSNRKSVKNKVEKAPNIRGDNNEGGIFNYLNSCATRVGKVHYLKNDKFIGDSIDRYGEWAQNEIDFILNYINPGDVVFDIGANIGFHSLNFAQRVGEDGKVWSFEPDQLNGLILGLNVVDNNLADRITTMSIAASNEVAIKNFRAYHIESGENFGNTAIDNFEGTVPCLAVPLDAIVGDISPAFVKIDVEGHELSVLQGMRNIISISKPSISVEAENEDNADEIAAFLNSLGYDVYKFRTNAYNSNNFKRNKIDIWNGNGACNNLFCIIRGRHTTPRGLELYSEASNLSYELVQTDIEITGFNTNSGHELVFDTFGVSLPMEQDQSFAAWQNLRTEIRNFVGEFMQSGFGYLDGKDHAALVKHALSYLSAGSFRKENEAFKQLMFSGIKTLRKSLENSRSNREKTQNLESMLNNNLLETAQLKETASLQTHKAEQLQWQNQAFEEKLLQLNSKISSQETTISELTTAISTNQVRMAAESRLLEERFAKEIGEKNREINEKIIAISSFENEIATCEKQIIDLENKISINNADAANEIAKLSQAADKVAELSALLESEKAENQNSLAKIEVMREASEKQIEKLDTQIKALQRSNQNLQQELSNAKKSAQQTSELLEIEKTENQKSNSILTDLRKALAALEKEVAEGKDLKIEIANLQNENASNLSKAQSEIEYLKTALSNVLTALKTETVLNINLEDKLDKIYSKNSSELGTLNHELTRHIQEMSEASKVASLLENQNNELVSENLGLKSKLESLQQDILEFQIQLEEKDKLASDLRDLLAVQSIQISQSH